MPSSRHSQAEVVIRNRQGLHTRPAKVFVETASRFACEITVSKGELSVNGKSIMGLMSLLAPPGTRLVIAAKGADAQPAVERLVALVTENFGEAE